jgi:hypothetical protein
LAISPKWKTDDAFNTNWSVAQVRGTFSDVVSALAKSRSYRDSDQSGRDVEFCVSDDARSPLIAYATSSSEWTYLEGIWGPIDFGPLIRFTKTAKTDLLVADYCDAPSAMVYGHFLNGRLVEQFMTIDPEWPENRGLDGKEKKWKTNSTQTQCWFGKRESVLDIETNYFTDWWGDVSESLSLDTPYRCWTDWVSDDRLNYEKSEVPDMADAHLFVGT